MPRVSTQTLDLERSMDFDKELFLDELVKSMHTTVEEFDRLYILEEFPMEITVEDYYDLPKDATQIRVSTRQDFTIRLKTAEEMTEDVSRHITQGEN